MGSAVELIAIVFAVVVLAEFLMVLLIKPKTMLNFAKKVYTNKILTVVYVLLVLVLGYYLLLELDIYQLFAAAMFGMLVYGLALIQYPKQILKLFKEMLKNKYKVWMLWLILIVMSLWVLYVAYGGCPSKLY